MTRKAMNSNSLCDPSSDRVGHNFTSSLFASESGLVDWILLLAELSAPMARKLAEVTTKYRETQEKNETAFNILNNADLLYFDYITLSLVEKTICEICRMLAGPNIFYLRTQDIPLLKRS